MWLLCQIQVEINPQKVTSNCEHMVIKTSALFGKVFCKKERFLCVDTLTNSLEQLHTLCCSKYLAVWWLVISVSTSSYKFPNFAVFARGMTVWRCRSLMWTCLMGWQFLTSNSLKLYYVKLQCLAWHSFRRA